MDNYKIPDYLTRYYVNGENPFLSLNDLPLEKANNIKMDASDKYEWGGFYAQNDYLIHRREIEKWIYNKLLKKGIKPPNEIPVYMVLGDYGNYKKFKADTAILTIPLYEVDISFITFVWPDSMYEPVIGQSGEFTGNCQRTDTPKVYFYNELEVVMEEIERFNRIKNKHIPYACIEAQVWNRNMLEEWYQRNS